MLRRFLTVVVLVTLSMSLVFCSCHSLSKRSFKLFDVPLFPFLSLAFVLVDRLGRYVRSLLDSDSDVVSPLCTKLADFLLDTLWLGFAVGVFGVDVAW